jgi:hypothetical protein
VIIGARSSVPLRFFCSVRRTFVKEEGKGKGIMVSAFLTPGGILKAPDQVPDEELLANPTWPKDEKGRICHPRSDRILRIRKASNYWTGEKMVEQVARVVIPIFNYVFPDCEGFFAFDNASNHCAFTPNALVAAKMNLMPGGKQPLLHNGWDYSNNRPQSMVFGDERPKESGKFC